MRSNILPKLLTCFLCAQALSAGAQNNYDVQFTNAVKDKIRPDHFLGTDTSGNIYIACQKTKPKVVVPLAIANYYDLDIQKYLKVYDRNLNLVENKQILAANEGIRQSQINGSVKVRTFMIFPSISIRNVDHPSFIVGNRYYMVVTNDKKPYNDYHVADINPELGMVDKMIPLFSLGKKREEHHLDILNLEQKFSPDSSHILFLASYKKDKSNVAYSAAVFTKAMEPVWHSDYTLPKVTKTFTYGEAEVGNQGEVMILGRNYNKKEKNNPGYSSIFYMDQQQLKPKETRLNFGGDFVVQTQLSLNTGSKPMIIGYYRNDRKKSGFDGLWYANLDEQRNMYNIRKKEFNLDFITSNFTKEETRKLKRKEERGKNIKDAGDYVFNEFFPTPDGGYVGIAEEYYLVIIENRDSKTGMVKNISYQHHYDDLMIFKFNHEGTITSMNKVAKSNTYLTQGSNKPYEKDYANCEYDKTMYVVFNDNGGLDENRHDTKRDRLRNKTTYIVGINENGELKKEVLIEKNAMGKYTYDPHLSICKLANNKIAFLATKGKGRTRKTKIGTFTLKNG